jgi:hypothetical protein
MDGCTLLCFRYQEIIFPIFLLFGLMENYQAEQQLLNLSNLASVVVVKDRTILKLYLI